MEKRLIDANKLNKKKKYSFQTQGGCFPKNEWFIKADDLFNAPTVDAVEVVRCGKCRKWLNDSTCHTFINGEKHPMGCCQHTRRFTADCDFCSYGERRSDG